MSDDFKIAHPREYFEEFIKHNIRPDGRQLEQFRHISFDQDCIKTADGSSITRLGNTIVSCGIKAELAIKSKDDTSIENAIVANVHLTPLCSPEYKAGAPSVRAQTLSQAITDRFNSSFILDSDRLVIPESKEMQWVLFADILCINDDGNLFDASYLATLVALMKVNLPKVVKDVETGEVSSLAPSDAPTNIIKQLATPSTFAIFNSCTLLPDPTREEETLSCSQITIVVGADKQISLCQKEGGAAITKEVLGKCFDLAEERAVEVKQILTKTITM